MVSHEDENVTVLGSILFLRTNVFIYGTKNKPKQSETYPLDYSTNKDNSSLSGHTHTHATTMYFSKVLAR